MYHCVYKKISLCLEKERERLSQLPLQYLETMRERYLMGYMIYLYKFKFYQLNLGICETPSFSLGLNNLCCSTSRAYYGIRISAANTVYIIFR